MTASRPVAPEASSFVHHGESGSPSRVPTDVEPAVAALRARLLGQRREHVVEQGAPEHGEVGGFGAVDVGVAVPAVEQGGAAGGVAVEVEFGDDGQERRGVRVCRVELHLGEVVGRELAAVGDALANELVDARGAIAVVPVLR